MTSSSGGRRATASELGKNEAWNHVRAPGNARGRCVTKASQRTTRRTHPKQTTMFVLAVTFLRTIFKTQTH